MAIDPKKIAEWKRRASDDNCPDANGVILALLSEREEMLAVLRTLHSWMDIINEGCPVCHQDWGMGDIHAPDCRLDALLR